MWTKLFNLWKRYQIEVERFNYSVLTLGIVINTYTALLLGNAQMLKLEGAFAALWILMIWITSRWHAQEAREKKHDSDIDTDRLARLSLPEVYEDYLRRKSQAQALYEAEVESLDKDYAQYLNALEEEAMEKDAS